MGGFGTLKLSGQITALVAALHAVAIGWSGFGGFGAILLALAVVYFGLALGLTRGMRGLGYLAFVVLLAGAVAAYAWVGRVAVPDGILLAMLGAKLLAVLTLFVALWRPRTV